MHGAMGGGGDCIVHGVGAAGRGRGVPRRGASEPRSPSPQLMELR